MLNQPLVSFRDALDIVFANRNRSYGAYALRREYPRNLGKAFGLGLFLIGTALLLPHLLNAVGRLMPEPPPVEVTAILGPPPDIVTTPPPPPPPPIPTPPPPTRSLQRFVPPIVEKDNLVNETEPQKSVEELVDNNDDIGNKNVKVDEEGAPSLVPDKELTAIETPTPSKDEDEPVEMFVVNKPPTFPGGDKELFKFLSESIKYPPLARENNIQGTVALSFVIGKDGSVTDIAILKDIGGGCGKEAVRVVQSMPNWMPGEAAGHAVKVRYTLPVRFQLQ